jgi:hypothetical protein
VQSLLTPPIPAAKQVAHGASVITCQTHHVCRRRALPGSSSWHPESAASDVAAASNARVECFLVDKVSFAELMTPSGPHRASIGFTARCCCASCAAMAISHQIKRTSEHFRLILEGIHIQGILGCSWATSYGTSSTEHNLDQAGLGALIHQNGSIM